MSVPSDIMLRPARPGDIADIVRISAGIWDGEDYVPLAATKWMSDACGRFIVAEHDCAVRGFGRIVMDTAVDAWAEGLRVDPSFRRRGVARAIVRYLLDEARALGATSLRFSTPIDNIESITLNESFGCKKIAGLCFFNCDRDQFPANAPLPDAVLLMDAATESQPDAWEFVISVLEGEPASCWALLSAAFDSMSREGMKSACACVPCNSSAAAILEEAGFERWRRDVPAESPTVLLYEYSFS
ncbi:MAG: GNAT family N-acetyltransferase [Firmicutes bacterium]|nr:GNAT family N-acetyltransferase [Bacillota bacterium]